MVNDSLQRRDQVGLAHAPGHLQQHRLARAIDRTA
jgi:hypothetical protein